MLRGFFPVLIKYNDIAYKIEYSIIILGNENRILVSFSGNLWLDMTYLQNWGTGRTKDLMESQEHEP